MARSLPPKAFWPMVVDATNNKIDLVWVATPYTATVAAGTYYSFSTLAAAVVAALTAQIANDWSCEASSSGRVTVRGGSAFDLRFATGANAATYMRHVLGFGAVDTAHALTVTGALQHQNGWYPERPCVFDTREEYERTSAGAVSLEGQTRLLTFGSEREIRRVSFDWLPEWKTKIAREGAYTNEALERLWRTGYAQFRWWPDAATEGAYGDFSLDHSLLSAFAPGRDEKMQLYAYTLKMRKVIP